MRNLIVFMALISAFKAKAQADLSLYSAQRVPQSHLLNPAFQPESNFYIGIPTFSSLGFQFNNTAFTLSEVVGKDVENPNMALNDIANRMDKNAHFSFSQRTEWLSFGFGFKNSYLHFGAGFQTFGAIDYPAELLRFMFPNSNNFSSVQFNINNTRMEILSTQNYYVGYQHSFWQNKLNAGLKMRYHFALAHAFAERFLVDVEGDAQTLNAQTDVLIKTSSPSSFENNSTFFPNNSGATFDFGLMFNPNKHWEIGLSVLDLGSIDFNDNVRTYQSQGEYEFLGFEFDAIQGNNNSQSVLDEIDSVFKFSEIEGGSYKRRLPVRSLASVRYNINQHHAFNFIFHQTAWDSYSIQDYSFGYRFRTRQSLELLLNYNIIDGIANHIGGGLVLGGGAVQFHLLSDNFAGWFQPSSANTFSLRFGLNLRFGRNRMEKRSQKALQIPRESGLPPSKKPSNKKEVPEEVVPTENEQMPLPSPLEPEIPAKVEEVQLPADGSPILMNDSLFLDELDTIGSNGLDTLQETESSQTKIKEIQGLETKQLEEIKALEHESTENLNQGSENEANSERIEETEPRVNVYPWESANSVPDEPQENNSP